MGEHPWIAFFIGLVVGFGCDPSDDEETGEPILSMGQFCDTGFPDDCPSRRCQDVVGGESCDNISCTNWGLEANQGTICTQTCSADSDCSGIDFAGTNEEQVSAEEWFCSAGVCHVLVTAPERPDADICAGCGGVFCSGRCIGCPDC